MTTFRSDLLRELHQRGFVHQLTDAEGLDAAAAKPGLVGYIGFDCTADSLHVGSLVQIMMLRWMQKLGHRPIALMGGGTTKVGDPSGRDDMRQLLDDAAIEHNKAAIRDDISRFVDFRAGAEMLDNAAWLDDLRYIPFLRDVGRHFSVNRMLSMDSVKLRLERDQPFSFLEFNYMLLQAYDFVELSRRRGCRMQMGGSDQWGNIVMGVELGRRLDGSELFGLTTPLITTASGAKMGKTASGAVWLNPDRLSDWDYWQYWRNVEDADVGRFLRLFTDLELDEIARLETLGGAEINEAKKRLADEATALCRGRDAAARAAATAREVFEQGGAGGDLPVFEILDNQGRPLTQLLVEAQVSASASESRRLIEAGGIYVNDQPVTDWKTSVSASDVGSMGFVKVTRGKKKHVLLKPKG